MYVCMYVWMDGWMDGWAWRNFPGIKYFQKLVIFRL